MITRRLAAILLLDVVGYSRLMQGDDIRTLRDLRSCRKSVIDPAIAAHNGRIVNNPGDSILTEFASVQDAAQCAIAIQCGMARLNAEVPENKRISFRIGINVGDVIVEGTQIFGDGVNIAARVESLCEPGGLCISRVAHEQVRDKLPVKFTDRGEHPVKNIARPLRIFGLSAAAIAALLQEPAIIKKLDRLVGSVLDASSLPQTIILAAEIAGSAEANAARAAVSDTTEIFSGYLPEHHGRIAQIAESEIVATFESPADAVFFAFKLQELVSTSTYCEGQKIGVRTGIDMDPSDHEKEEVSQHGVNRARSITNMAPIGGTLVCEFVYRSIRMRPEFGFECLGARPFQNAAEPIEIYRVYEGDVAISLKPSRRPHRDLWRSPGVGEPHEERRERPAIAVLPFRNLSGDDEQSVFADGTTEDIITSLTHFRALDVIAPGSAFAFRGKSTPSAEIGHQFRVDYVARGSIRWSSYRVRVTIQLDEVATNRVVWAERYDRPLEDIFDIQDQIVELATAAMAVSIEESEFARVRALAPESLHAYGLLLSGRGRLSNFTAADTAFARRCYERALLVEPTYGRALSELSRTHSLDWRYSWSDDPSTSLDEALGFARQAVECAHNDARGHAEIGFVRLYRKEHDASIAAYRSALALNPNDANVIAEFADALSHAGQPDDALPLFKRAMRLNPFYPDQYLWDMAGAYFKLRAFEEAIECISRMHNRSQGRRLLAACYGHLGRLDEARHQAALILAAQPGFSSERWARNIVPDKRQEDTELFVAGLKTAGL